MPRPATARRQKKKTTLEEYKKELEDEEAAEAAASSGQPGKSGSGPMPPIFGRALLKEHLQPLIDLSFSSAREVQLEAVVVLSTLSINDHNKDELLACGALKPMLGLVSSPDLRVCRHALSGLAHLTEREDICAKLCAFDGGLEVVIAAAKCRDVPSMVSAAEVLAHVAGSHVLRGKLVAAGGLDVLSICLDAKSPALKRLGMLAMQRLALSGVKPTKEDPDGDGYANEILDQGALRPIVDLLAGGPRVPEELRTQATKTIWHIADANVVVQRALGQQSELCTHLRALILAEDHMAGATQKEACRCVQLLLIPDENIEAFLSVGLLDALVKMARMEAMTRKQFASTILSRLATEPTVQARLLDAASRTLCGLCRTTYPRKVIKPAAQAIAGMSPNPLRVAKMLEAGAGEVLAALTVSGDPELRSLGVAAIADMIEANATDKGRVADQLLAQGCLGAVLSVATVASDRPTMLSSARALRHLVELSPTHARIVARKGGARALCMLVLSRDSHVLTNAVAALCAVALALSAPSEEKAEGARGRRQSLAFTKAAKRGLRDILEVGIVGSPKELWARLNDDGGMPAAQMMRVARASRNSELGRQAATVLNTLKPGSVADLVEADMPEVGGYAPHAVAERRMRLANVVKIQKQFRKLVRSRHLQASAPQNRRMSYASPRGISADGKAAESPRQRAIRRQSLVGGPGSTRSAAMAGIAAIRYGMHSNTMAAIGASDAAGGGAHRMGAFAGGLSDRRLSTGCVHAAEAMSPGASRAVAMMLNGGPADASGADHLAMSEAPQPHALGSIDEGRRRASSIAPRGALPANANASPAAASPPPGSSPTGRSAPVYLPDGKPPRVEPEPESPGWMQAGSTPVVSLRQ